MKRSSTISLLVAGILLLISTVAFGFETDQYNLPPEPLADIGDEVSAYVESKLIKAVAHINSEIDRSVKCLETRTKNCGSRDAEQKKLDYLRSNKAVAEAAYKMLGDGNLFTTNFGNWMRSHKFRGQPDRYKTSYGESIFILNPTDYLTISPTVRLYGTEFGIDKLEHFFQQGYHYYRIETDAGANNMVEAEAAKKAVKWGQLSERTYYGLLVSGVFSNADLYANYVGMKFYDGLTKPLKINDGVRPPTLILTDGSWNIDASSLRENLVKPFIADHLNEACNPSAFRFTLVRSVRRAVKKYACPDWHQTYPNLTRDDLTEHTKTLELWNGEDYGFTKRGRMVTIADTCFSD